MKIHWGRFALLAGVVFALLAVFGGTLLRALLGFGVRVLILLVIVGLLVAGFHRVKRTLSGERAPESRR